jgi:hypothetical protein
MALQIQRQDARQDRTRRYRIYVDGILVGDVGNGETKELDLEPGSHLLRLKIDWTGSPEIPVEGGADRVVVRCRPNTKGTFLGRAIMSYAKPRDWIVLEPIP